jgi:1-aminocyclopropane-1-carboxylate deaminase/D-cysteine desulfhydrase-like pyridoxal-dependent ACC family enzyme
MSLLQKFDRYSLTFGPMPFEHLPRLTEALAPTINGYGYYNEDG